MKKQLPAIAVCVTALFAAFTLGLFLGRNLNHTPVQVTALATEALSTTPATEADTIPSTEAAALSAVREEPPQVSPAPTESESHLININTATAEDLVTLPGIGEVLAGRIIAYREANGPFLSTEELILVSGIGEKKLAAIMDLITVGG